MRKVYIYSNVRDYILPEYIEKFTEENAELLKGDKKTLQKFIDDNEFIQVDVETNVVDTFFTRELYVVQLGDYKGFEQHIFDYTDLTKELLDLLTALFKSKEKKFIAHNAKFEYIMIKQNFGASIDNIEDTYLGAKLLNAGLNLEPGYNGLKHQVHLRLGIEMSKDEQTTFTGAKMLPDQLVYATTDVLFMGKLLDLIRVALKRWKLLKVYKLECAAVRPTGEYTINGILVDVDALDENIVEFTTAFNTARNAMIEMLRKEDGKTLEILKAKKIIQPYDEVNINWKSSTQKKLLLGLLYPKRVITSTAVKALTTLLADLTEEEDSRPLELLIEKNTDKLTQMLVNNHLEFLKKSSMYVPEGFLNINWNSPAQLLDLFRVWYPQLNGVGAKAIKKLKNPVIDNYKGFVKASKLLSSFGEKMKSYIESDGRIHGNFTQLVPSGSRMSSSKPNLQQMPSTESYRRIFVPRPGWKLVDADYSSAELFLAAFLSKDANMMYAVKHGYDMHSYSASLIFGEDWINAGGSTEPIGKPTTVEANKYRKFSKGLSFSLLYGTGVQAFSDNMGITAAEGKLLMKKYFDTFPQLAAFFTASGESALKQFYIREPFFGRVRFFDRPTNGMERSHVKNASMNYKPQAANGSIMKYATVLLFRYLEEKNLTDYIVILLVVHDQLLVEAKNGYEEKAAKLVTHFMEKAALHAIPSGELKAESMILNHWTK